MATISDMLSAALRHFQADEIEPCARLCGQILSADPNHVTALQILSALAKKTAQHDLSEQLLRQALELQPDNADLWFDLGSALMHAGQREEAVEAYHRAAQLRPDWNPPCINLGALYEQLEQYDDAEQWCRRALAIRPDSAAAQHNLGHVYRARGEVEAAIACYQTAIEHEPDNWLAHWNLGLCYLLAGDFAQGWPHYEWRARAGEVVWDHYRQPRWDGSSLAGKTLLVHAEQGVGDEILFASCYPDLIEQAGRCIFVCDPRLAPLFQRSFPGAEVHGHARRKDRQPAGIDSVVDFQIPAGSVPALFRKRLADFPERDRFLIAPRAQIEEYRAAFDRLGPGLKVGISWRAGGKPSEHRKRTTVMEQWRGLFAVAGVHWINLQYGDVSEELSQVRQWGVEIHDPPGADPLVDLDRFAAKLSALDLVISVGNATVHLAGALGIPTWTVLPHVPAWRWLLRGETTPWYSSVRLFRQASRGDWQSVFKPLADQLRALTAERGTNVVRWNNKAQGQAEQPEISASGQAPACRQSTIFTTADITPTLRRALALHKEGNLTEAEQLYREILLHAPRHADALHLLGAVARQSGRLQLAIESIQRAIAVQPRSVFHYNLADSLRAAGRCEEAISHYHQALEIKPDFAEAAFALGTLLRDTGAADEAVTCFEQAIRARSDYGDAYLQLGKLQQDRGCVPEALATCRRAVELQPHSAKAHNALGAALLADNQQAAAIACFRQAVDLDTEYAAGWNNLGRALQEQGQLTEAVACARRAAELQPSFETLNNCGCALQKLGEFEEAIAYFRKALALRPDVAETHNDLGAALQELGRLTEATEHYARAIDLQPDFVPARMNRALAWLQSGNFYEGWTEYEWRWQTAEQRPHRPHLDIPQWDGGSLAGKTILVYGEQGVGDEIMFATCLPDVISCAGECIVVCDVRLVALLARSFPSCTIYGMRRGQEQQWQLPAGVQVDLQVAAGSLPRYLRPTIASFPRQRQLLTADPQRVAGWKQRLAQLGSGPKIGISWRGGTKPDDRRLRWTSLDQWSELLATPGVHFVSLQYGNCAEELATIARTAGTTVHAWPEIDADDDLDNFAAKIAALDLVISVGNANVHLAGAMGTPAWALLPRYAGWRWLIDRHDTPWYESVRLFRQTQPGDWKSVFERIRHSLATYLSDLRIDRETSTERAGHTAIPAPLTLPPGPPFASSNLRLQH